MSTKLSYSSLSLDYVQRKFCLTMTLQELFDEIVPISPSSWLEDSWRRAGHVAVISEKARSEFLVAPILLEVKAILKDTISIYSGIRFDVSSDEGLQGICDFIISRSEPLPTLQSPLVIMVEAKKNDIESGLGQCAGEMVAAQRFNMRDLPDAKVVYGCVTTGELWQFLKLDDKLLTIAPKRVYIEQIERILGMLVQMVQSGN